MGLGVALITAAVVGLIVSLLIQLALTAVVGEQVLMVLVAPLSEEPAKAIGIVAVVLFMWKIVPNRRYGAALGAAAGLGFGVAESILYIYGIIANNLPGELVVVRLLVTPLMHPLWSAFVGIGVFTLVSKKSTNAVPYGLSIVFLFIGIVNHIIWNAIALLSGLEYVAILLNAVVIFPIFAIVLRDFLGGHFNFLNFFEPLPEPYPTYLTISPPPPPPPPV